MISLPICREMKVSSSCRISAHSLKSFCEQRKLLPASVIERSQIERTYGHQLFNGTRRPSRDKVIQLAFGLGLSVEETQRLLRAAGKSQLYPRLKRDAVILYGLQKGLPILAVQESLTKYGLTLLGGAKNGKRLKTVCRFRISAR